MTAKRPLGKAHAGEQPRWELQLDRCPAGQAHIDQELHVGCRGVQLCSYDGGGQRHGSGGGHGDHVEVPPGHVVRATDVVLERVDIRKGARREQRVLVVLDRRHHAVVPRGWHRREGDRLRDRERVALGDVDKGRADEVPGGGLDERAGLGVVHRHLGVDHVLPASVAHAHMEMGVCLSLAGFVAEVDLVLCAAALAVGIVRRAAGQRRGAQDDVRALREHACVGTARIAHVVTNVEVREQTECAANVLQVGHDADDVHLAAGQGRVDPRRAAAEQGAHLQGGQVAQGTRCALAHQPLHHQGRARDHGGGGGCPAKTRGVLILEDRVFGQLVRAPGKG